MIEIFTDGACSGNPGPGGWAGLIRVPGCEDFHVSGGDSHTTNNRMEMKAAINSIKFVIEREKLCIDSEVILYSDSKYVIDGITSWILNWRKNGWRTSSGKPVENKDLWEELHSVCCKLKVRWVWVKGHSNHSENEIVNAAAQKIASSGGK
ncbi:ribonuclease HI [Candidatus Hydrogenosomobacter endosymbioticus]|uniref:Ribonuclease H n=1 Tax=Candidatus Hydrogenosomobacter endosymbioticus TaxID=2558174 RepID=A0ABN6L2I9_9PROT|nr:ribonuclease HI [Candidatus Hydrogenosomobacter endosymbioticus]BDB96038.1 ribonuclease H [Candidatus Hydrogenosomobacter endosymbioticus]